MSQVNVTDVNDNPPFLSWPREVWVEENSAPRVVATVTLGDPDDWRQAHGPPFTLMLDPMAPEHVATAVRVTHDQSEWLRKGVDGWVAVCMCEHCRCVSVYGSEELRVRVSE